MRRIDVKLFFSKDSDADKAWAWLKANIPMSKLKNIAEEHSYIEYHDCHHDTNPPRPCEIIERFEK